MHNRSNEIRVRFAPSPTGFLHIGGARTAIFNWLFAKHYLGKFLLRIEDTDKARSSAPMITAIMDGLKWLGMDWDEQPIFQSERIESYQRVCNQLIESGHAYYCYCSQKIKEEVNDSTYTQKIDDRCRYLTSEDRSRLDKENIPKVVRFKVEHGMTQFNDEVHGSLTTHNDQINDFIILRSDGIPTYHLAVVADDIAMRITTVIRGDDHISNTPKQIMIYEALGSPLPQFAHVPLILGHDQKRLSKRHGATSISEYRNAGYLSEVMFNYLTLLGWSPGDDREILSRDELIQAFSLSKISAKNAIFDEKKLLWMNGQYINKMPDQEICEHVVPDLIDKRLISAENIDRGYIQKTIQLLKQKVRLIPDFADLGFYFYRDPKEFDEKARRKYWTDNSVIDTLRALENRLAKIESFNKEIIEHELRSLAEDSGVAAANIIHPTRLALTGFGVSPGLFELMELLGKDTVLRRIGNAIHYLAGFEQ